MLNVFPLNNFKDDDILIICLIFLLYQEKNQDYSLYIILVLLLFT